LIRRPIKNRPGSRRSRSITEHSSKRGREPVRVHKRPSTNQSSLNYLTVQSGGKDWEVRPFNNRSNTAIAVSLRRSNAWLTRAKFPTTSVELPFIDHVGRFTGHSVYTVNWSPPAYLATVFATIWRRLKFLIVRRHGIGEFNKRQNLYMKCCAYYALTKNIYFWNRLLSLSRKKEGWKTVSGVLHGFSSKLDDNKWFVYGRVCLQTYWLTFRAVRPRDKSAFKQFQFPTRDRKVSGRELDRFEYDAVWDAFVKVSQLSS